jgi:hypothetical protein
MEVRLNYLELDSITGEDLILDTTTSEELLLDTIGTRLSSNEPHLGYTKGFNPGFGSSSAKFGVGFVDTTDAITPQYDGSILTPVQRAELSKNNYFNTKSELLREPNLLVPGKKPVGPVKIDESHSLAQDLSGYAHLNGIYSWFYVDGAYEAPLFYAPAYSQWMGRWGNIVYSANSAGVHAMHSNSSVSLGAASGGFTCAGHFSLRSGVATFTYFAAIDRYNPGLAVNNNEYAYTYLGGSAGQTSDSDMLTAGVGLRHFLLGTRQEGTALLRFYFDNVQTDDITGKTDAAGGGRICIHSSSDIGDNPGNDDSASEWFGFWHRELSATERDTLMHDPYCFLIPV